MKNVSDQAAIERILKAIAQDDELIRQFAMVVGVSTETFDKWIDTFQVPPMNVSVPTRRGLTATLGPLGIVIDTPLKP